MRKPALAFTLVCLYFLSSDILLAGWLEDHIPVIVFGPAGIPFTPEGSKAVETISQNTVKFQGEVRGTFERAFGPEVAEIMLVGQTQAELAAHMGVSFSALTEAIRSGQINADSYTAILLAAGLRQAYARHIGNSRPIPNTVKTILLAGGVGSEMIDSARYTVGNVEITLNNGINVFQKLFGNDHAVVTQNLIVFSREPSADSKSEILWWGHELTHVFQYKTMGVDRFAWEYIKNRSRIENGADNNANFLWSKICQAEAHPDC